MQRRRSGQIGRGADDGKERRRDRRRRCASIPIEAQPPRFLPRQPSALALTPEVRENRDALREKCRCLQAHDLRRNTFSNWHARTSNNDDEGDVAASRHFTQSLQGGPGPVGTNLHINRACQIQTAASGAQACDPSATSLLGCGALSQAVQNLLRRLLALEPLHLRPHLARQP